jgi:uncharacterized membrane protein YphA (DoxX/SURF4 family)
MGFQVPVILAPWIIFDESIGAFLFLVGSGLFTRVLAVNAALEMVGALYTRVRPNEDWLRAALYLILFITMSLTGPGRLSIDQRLQTRKRNRLPETPPGTSQV